MSATTTTDKSTDNKAAADNKAQASRVSTAGSSDKDSKLVSDQGTTSIADIVVQKVAGLAAREVRGVHDLGGGAARAFGAIRDRIPGASTNVGQGVSVEVGETQAAVDLELVVEYGVAIAELARAVRRNVINAIEQMTGLDVVEVNINVNDVYIPGDDDEPEQSSRVQ
ncbi:Asp23/Gls24 family envelope stress response protein [Nocardia sp. CS682]|uniref:Asp23/Gls24 family envelope stress response protein n=1 Tax=Nocardia sp. CS682 TaxID=1047172 RepID=UPI0010755902|nr:Asp23/Gls24 family envelope stress response protein [Nocardia sp. CS682]QBS44360.1 Asp23/Gls24 family envelope stress response protein [Nocardia sp. CS682]